MATKKSVVITTEPMRCSFANVHEPREDLNGKMQYSICLMADQSDKKLIASLKKHVQEAITIGVENGVFPKGAVKSLKLPLRNGTVDFKNEERGKEFDGHIYFNANTKKPPGIANKQGRPSVGDVEIYSGCWVRAHISFYPYDAKNKQGKSIRKGVAIGLNHVMFVKNDDRFDGRIAVEDAFSEFREDDDGAEQTEGDLI